MNISSEILSLELGEIITLTYLFQAPLKCNGLEIYLSSLEFETPVHSPVPIVSVIHLCHVRSLKGAVMKIRLLSLTSFVSIINAAVIRQSSQALNTASLNDDNVIGIFTPFRQPSNFK